MFENVSSCVDFVVFCRIHNEMSLSREFKTKKPSFNQTNSTKGTIQLSYLSSGTELFYDNA